MKAENGLRVAADLSPVLNNILIFKEKWRDLRVFLNLS
jgi:hypothetical protein